MDSLRTKGWLGFFALAAVMGAVLFALAGTFDYWEAWVYLGIFFGASGAITFYLMRKDPTLLQRRLRAGPIAEKEPAQKLIMLLASTAFLASLGVSALDHRVGWSALPLPAIIGGELLTALSFYVDFLVFKENPFSSATIEVAQDQRVISTGPYAVVRHPMYGGGLLLFLGMPLALGSAYGLLAFVAALPALLWRLSDEERLLVRNLPGYRDYCARVRWRLIPGIY